VEEKLVTIGDTRVDFTCAFTREEVDAERESIIGKFCAEANISGFRKGKVPRNVVLMRFSDAIGKQLNSTIENKSVERMNLKCDKFVSASVIGTDVKATDGGMECRLQLEVIPDFALPDYWNISVAKFDTAASGGEIDREVRRFLKQYAKYSPVDRAAKEGDFVKLNYSGKFSNGSAVADGAGIPAIYGTRTNTWEEAGEHGDASVRAIVDGLIGVKAGDKKVVEEKFDRKFPVATLAGKTVKYELEIFEVRECELPELSPDMLRAFSVKSEAELREKMRTSLEGAKNARAQMSQRSELLDKLCAMCEVKIPESFVTGEASKLAEDFINQQVRNGAKVDDMRDRSQQILDECLPVAAQRAKIGAILEKIAKVEKIEIAVEDIENTLWQDIRSQRLDSNKYIGELKRDSGKVVDLRRRALHGKVLDRLMEGILRNLKHDSKSAADTKVAAVAPGAARRGSAKKAAEVVGKHAKKRKSTAKPPPAEVEMVVQTRGRGAVGGTAKVRSTATKSKPRDAKPVRRNVPQQRGGKK
jgi:trigger factor